MVSLEVLRQCTLFGELSDEELHQVAAICQEETFEAGTQIFGQDEIAQKVYILQSGRVMLCMYLRSDIEPDADLCIEESQPGRVFGWSALVKQKRFTASAVALDPVSAISIQGDQLNALFEEHPHIGFLVMRRLADVISDRLRLTRRAETGRELSAAGS